MVVNRVKVFPGFVQRAGDTRSPFVANHFAVSAMALTLPVQPHPCRYHPQTRFLRIAKEDNAATSITVSTVPFRKELSFSSRSILIYAQSNRGKTEDRNLSCSTSFPRLYSWVCMPSTGKCTAAASSLRKNTRSNAHFPLASLVIRSLISHRRRWVAHLQRVL